MYNPYLDDELEEEEPSTVYSTGSVNPYLDDEDLVEETTGGVNPYLDEDEQEMSPRDKFGIPDTPDEFDEAESYLEPTEVAPEVADEPIEVPLTSNHLPESVEARFNSDLAVFELRDLIEACCETEEERTIVRMREQGYVDREIAETLDMPLSTTYMLRRGIQERFLERSAAEDEA